MSTVADFPLRNAIVVDFGTVTESTDATQVGKQMFIVSYADDGGFEWSLDYTTEYVIASRLAQNAAAGFLVTNIIERFRQTDNAL